MGLNIYAYYSRILLLSTYYSQNYASIICQGLHRAIWKWSLLHEADK